MSRKPNRDRAEQIMSRHRSPLPRPVGTRRGNSLFLDLRGPILFSGEQRAGIDADAVLAVLKENRTVKSVFVDIDSGGGALLPAQKIYSALRAHPGFKMTNANQLCASAATLILMAGDFRTCEANTKFMIHNPEAPVSMENRWTAARHSRAAATLKRMSAELVKTYVERTGLDARLFENEIQRENIMGTSRAIRFGLVHCLAGHERWINGRPYYFPDERSYLGPKVVAAFSPPELEDMVRMNPDRWQNSPIGHMAFATPSIAERR